MTEKIEKVWVLGMEEWSFPIRRPHLVGICAVSRLSHDIGSKLFRINVWAVFLLASASKLKTFSRILFPGRAIRDWLRGGVYNFTPMSGFVQLLKVNSQDKHEMEHQNSACAQQFQRTAVSAHQKNSQQRRCDSQTTCIRRRGSTMGQIHEGRLAAGEMSLRKAPPCMHCWQQCRQSRSRRVLSTVANLIWVV